MQTNKQHRFVFFAVCLALAVLLGWPSSARADSHSDFLTGYTAGNSQAWYDGWNASYGGTYDPSVDDSLAQNSDQLAGVHAAYDDGYNGRGDDGEASWTRLHPTGSGGGSVGSTVPTVDYTGVSAVILTWARDHIQASASFIVVVTVLFAGFLWLRSNLKRSAAGR